MRSESLHHPWLTAPSTAEDFDRYLQRSQQDNEKSFLVCKDGHLAGVININQIVLGCFQSAYLGFYAFAGFENQGVMTAGLQLVLQFAFENLMLHRLEANIQPDNFNSIHFVKRNKFNYEGFSPRYLNINGQWQGHEHWVFSHEDYLLQSAEIIQKDQIEIVSYQAEWPNLAKLEIDKIKSVFPPTAILAIEHIGSTAVEGLSAKPITDIQIAVNSLDMMHYIAIPLLQKLEYELLKKKIAKSHPYDREKYTKVK